MGGGYEQIGSASDVSNVNPLTGPQSQNLGNQFTQFMAQLGNYAPGAQISGLQGMAPQIAGTAEGLMGAYGGAQNALALQQARQAAQGVAGEYGGMNALQSGAYQGALQQATMSPFLQTATNLGQMQTQLAGGFANQYLGAGQNMANIYGGLGQQAMQGQTQLAMPEWYEPAYGYQPGFGDYFSQIAGAGLGALTGGALGGGGGGWLASLFGGGGGGGYRPPAMPGQGLLQETTPW